MSINKPVFFIGMPRSGTTIIFEAFSRHEQIGYISNYSVWFSNYLIIEYITRLFDNKFIFLRGEKKQGQKTLWFNKLLPKPLEGYPLWERICGDKFLWSYLISKTASSEEVIKIIKTFEYILRSQGKNRFATKITGPSRIGFLNSIFSDGIFIHIIRDGRAVVNSLMNYRYWVEKGGLDKIFWYGGLRDSDIEEWERWHRSPVALAAIQWRRVIQVARREKARLPSSQYLEIRYEDFLDKPVDVLNFLFEFSGLPHSRRSQNFIMKENKLEDKNYKYKKMASKDILMMNEILEDSLVELGYPI